MRRGSRPSRPTKRFSFHFHVDHPTVIIPFIALLLPLAQRKCIALSHETHFLVTNPTNLVDRMETRPWLVRVTEIWTRKVSFLVDPYLRHRNKWPGELWDPVSNLRSVPVLPAWRHSKGNPVLQAGGPRFPQVSAVTRISRRLSHMVIELNCYNLSSYDLGFDFSIC